MPTGANIHEAYSISEPRTGNARVSRLVLTGWGAAPASSAGLMAFSDQGRLWGVYTVGAQDTVTFYRRPEIDPAFAVCTGTVLDGRATLAQASSSGITGSVDIDNGTPGVNPDKDATFDVVVSYCDEIDIIKAGGKLGGLLEGSPATYMGLGGVRFERLLIDSKAELDRWLVSNLEPRLRYDEWDRPLLAHIVRLGDLSRIQALIAAHQAALARGAALNPEQLPGAEAMIAEARRSFKSVAIQLDYERRLKGDANQRGGAVRIWRS
jgi:hypothetical protein